MLFLLLAIMVILLIIIWAITHESKNKKYYNYTRATYPDAEDFEPEPFEKEDTKSVSSFAYPDPYEMAPEDRLFLNEDGELREDL